MVEKKTRFDPKKCLIKLPKRKKLPNGSFVVVESDYLEVKNRLLWFRTENTKGKILTNAIELTPDRAVFKATVIKDEDTMATAYGSETPGDFRDYIEKAETKSVGRALAMLGYGTQFAPEFEEGNHVVDSPVERPTVPTVNPAPAPKTAPPPRVAPPLKASTAPPPKPKAATPPPIPAPKPATGQITQDQLNQLIDYQAQFPLIRFQAAFDAFHIKKLEELNSVQANELLAQLKVYAEKRKSPAPAKPAKQEGK